MLVCNALVHSSQKYASGPQSLHHTLAFEHLQYTQPVSFENPMAEIMAGTSFGRISAHAPAAFSFLSVWESRCVLSDLDDDSLKKCSCGGKSSGGVSQAAVSVTMLAELNARALVPAS